MRVVGSASALSNALPFSPSAGPGKDFLKNALLHLRDALGLELIEQQQAGVFCIYKPGGLVFKVTVPYDVLEWYVDAIDGSGAIWSDWVDHYAANGESREFLADEMKTSIEQLLARVVQCEFRIAVIEHPESTRRLYLRAGEDWKELSIAALTWDAS
jgi:hypothetical protein